MGLDMYLYAEKYIGSQDEGYQELVELVGAQEFKPLDGYPSATVSVKTVQWRKANQVHQWFVDNVQGGDDDCGRHYVAREQVEQVRNLCLEVLADHSKAEELLPVSEGFFFGHYEYGEYYFAQLEETNTNLSRALNTIPSGWDFYYESSW